MAIVTCAECRGNVSTLAAACPHCGAPVSASVPPAAEPAPPDQAPPPAVLPAADPPPAIKVSNSDVFQSSPAHNSLPIGASKSKPVLALGLGVLAYFIVVNVNLAIGNLLAALLANPKGGDSDFKFWLFLTFLSGALAILAAGKLSAAIFPAFNRVALAALSYGAYLLIVLLALSVLPRLTPQDFGNLLTTLLGTGAGVCTLFQLLPAPSASQAQNQ